MNYNGDFWDLSPNEVADFLAHIEGRSPETQSEAKHSIDSATTKQIVQAQNAHQEEAKPSISHQSDSITEPKMKPQKAYSYKSFAELCKKPEPIRYLIEDYVQESALHLDFGAAGSGKSFVALDQACTIACPEIETWHDLKVRHAPVIYFAGEGAIGLRKRCALWAYEHSVNPETVQLFIIDEVFKLNDEESPEYSIENTIANIKAICDKPGLVVFDTLNRYIEGDENKAVDVGKFISACTLIMRNLGCAVKIVHHVGNALENKGRPRGSSSLIAAVDIATVYEKRGDNQIHIEQTKNKENQLKKGLILRLKQRTLPSEWNNEYGDPTTSCIVELDPHSRHNEPYTPEPVKEKTLTKTQIRARETYREAAIKSAIKLQDERTGHTLAAVYIDDWRKVFYETSSAETDDSRRAQFNTARKQLCENDKLLSRVVIEGRDYYCLDLVAEGEDGLRTPIASVIGKREQEE